MKVAILMGSKSDYEVVKKCEDLLKNFGVEVTTRVMSAHRTPDIAAEFVKGAKENGYDVIIGAAGKAAHLPGVIASFTTLPVIGLPIKSSTMDGLDSLLSIVQMPSGIPVATVAINGAENAGLLALEMMSLKYKNLGDALENYREEMRKKVIADDASLGGC
ncbi:5-(carboxyamino)imidazole ribonucleotide mutase [Anaeromicrobium sediminis]|uniref:N5-carboxyaminoimidazole ribonucleotide mutase n=1 Tax=Anaeromicrobium sediminis TaxID=1478221 RepID=A0A267MI65_9FIRM|nr:5-(carboxyamino)imidazole ribonucleotide mutase [Anaeromicrobium sediminis]PAB59274.1 5-(carboxyamino)imidazole ribonucleotide mutase [Anaeromicrobium sediminis]